MEKYREVKKHRKRVKRALDELGDDPASVLRELKITGTVGEAGLCPVANYVSERVDRRVWITQSYAFASRNDYIRDRRGIGVPEPVQNFICRFDTGRYPELFDEYSKTLFKV